MSFWDSVKGIATEIGRGIKEEAEERRQYCEKFEQHYEGASDEELIHIFRNSTGNRRYACMRMLRNRGYGSSDLE